MTSESSILFLKCKKCRKKFNLEIVESILEDQRVDTQIEDLIYDEFYEYPQVRVTSDFFKGKAGCFIQNTLPLDKFRCDCEEEHELNLYVEFYASSGGGDWNSARKGDDSLLIDDILDIMILSSDTLILRTNPCLLIGNEIWNIISSLIRRWIAMKKEIEIVSPFVDITTCWENLWKITKEVIDKRYRPPFIKTYTRYIQEFGKANIESQIKSLIRNITSKYNFKFLTESIEDDSIIIAEGYGGSEDYQIYWLLKKFLSQIYYTKTNFHLKYYACPDANELVLSSFNLSKLELNQYETFVLTNYPINFNKNIKDINWVRCEFEVPVEFYHSD